MKIEDAFILAKEDAPAFFEGVAREMRLVAPKRRFGGDVMFDVIGSPDEIVWDYRHDLYPPKRFLLGHYEDMLRYRANGEAAPEDLGRAPKTAIVAVRSCDVMAIRFQERFYRLPIVDPYYDKRAESTVLFSLVCNTPPRKECFCICTDSGPYLGSRFDVQLTDLGDRFLYEIGSEKGRRAGETGRRLLKPVEAGDWSERRRIELEADSLFETISYFAKALTFISFDEVPEAIWETLGSTCFRCGACTNLCPVCTCYTVDDLAEKGESYVRCRSWDSCQFAGFTREASGHNPRPTFGKRVYRRFYHKVSYQYVQRDGTHGCVGCGRCIATCLTKLGVPPVLKRIRRMMYEHLEPRPTVAKV